MVKYLIDDRAGRSFSIAANPCFNGVHLHEVRMNQDYH